eukprot:g904.t1
MAAVLPPARLIDESHLLKVLFLDVDGVLCLNEYATLQPELLANLRLVVEHTQCVVVVSSDWRMFPSKLRELTRALKMRGIRVIGKTRPTTSGGPDERPNEIKHFLNSFRERMKRQSKPFRIKRWCAVDDRNLPLEEGGEICGPSRFVRTDIKKGLTSDIAMKIINALNRSGCLSNDSQRYDKMTRDHPAHQVKVD